MNAQTTIQGILHTMEEATISQKGFEKRLFSIVNGAEIWQLEAHQGMSNEVARYQPGQPVTCYIQIQGRQWEKQGRTIIINTLRCWKIEAYDPEIEKQVNRAEKNVKNYTQ